jgi:hypothetical protein
MDRVMRTAPHLLLAAALGASALLIMVLSAPLTFFGDSWAILMERRELTVDTVLAPHNEHIIAVPVLVENLSLALFDMESPRPGQVALTICLLVTAWLLFVYVEQRLGAWPALFGASLLLFLGPAWEAILWPLEIGFVCSVLFGIAMLLVLDRDDRRGDVAAAAFLTAAILSSSLGIPFLAAAAVDLLLKRRSRGLLPRLFVLAIPVLVFLTWYAGWGSDASTNITLRNIVASPRFVMETVAFAAGGTLGLGTSPYEAVATPGWGYAVVVALAAGLVFRTARGGLPAAFWPVAAAAAASWFLTAFNQIPGREPTTSRYVYAGAVFLLLMAANALRGTRFGPRALVAMGTVTLAAVSVNAVVLEDGRNWLRDQTDLTRAGLAAIEIAETSVSSDFQLTPEIAGTPTLVNVTAGEYLDAAEEHGSPAYTVEELLRAPPAARRQADIVLSGALPLSTDTTEGSDEASGESCRTATGEGGGAGIRLAPGMTRIEVDDGPSATLRLRRFATGEFPVPSNPLPGGSATLLTIPRDRSRVPWRLEVSAQQPVAVCSVPAG